ncbi:MAG: hypothetical protein ABGX16_09915 [Pirellulales bacterium]
MSMQTEKFVLLPSVAPQRHWLAFLMICLGIASVWLFVLPRLAHLPAVQQRQATFDASGIDPAAMFYTELELLDSSNNRLRQWQREHPEALW